MAVIRSGIEHAYADPVITETGSGQLFADGLRLIFIGKLDPEFGRGFRQTQFSNIGIRFDEAGQSRFVRTGQDDRPFWKPDLAVAHGNARVPAELAKPLFGFSFMTGPNPEPHFAPLRLLARDQFALVLPEGYENREADIFYAVDKLLVFVLFGVILDALKEEIFLTLRHKNGRDRDRIVCFAVLFHV